MGLLIAVLIGVSGVIGFAGIVAVLTAVWLFTKRKARIKWEI